MTVDAAMGLPPLVLGPPGLVSKLVSPWLLLASLLVDEEKREVLVAIVPLVFKAANRGLATLAKFISQAYCTVL